jgi:hypothetical protein
MNKMKTRNRFLTALAATVAATLAIAACGGTPPAPPAVVTDTVTYEAFFQEDEIELFDISITYRDVFDGALETEFVNADDEAESGPLAWSVNYQGASVPFTASMQVNYTRKAGAPDKEVYQTGREFGIGYTTSKGSHPSGVNGVNTTPVGKAQLETYYTNIGARFPSSGKNDDNYKEVTVTE